MKKVIILNKKTNTEKTVMVGKVGECVFAVCQNVKETNDAIRWCNQHNEGDKIELDSYAMEIIDV